MLVVLTRRGRDLFPHAHVLHRDGEMPKMRKNDANAVQRSGTASGVKLTLKPVSRLEAKKFIASVHRHNNAPIFIIAAVSLRDDAGVIHGVGTLELPKARMLADGVTAEVSRVCTDGSRNACTQLYGALCRVAAGLGYQRVISYTLASEPGSSLAGAGFEVVAHVKPKDWSLRNRSRSGRNEVDLFGNPTTLPGRDRVRWERRVG